MHFNFDHVPNRRIPARSIKWTKYPEDVLPMWIADMDFPAPPPILNALHQSIDHGVLGYEHATRGLQDTVAARMDRIYGWKVDPDAILAITGVVDGFNLAAKAFCTPRRGYLVQSPVYNEFHRIQINVGVKEFDAPMRVKASGTTLRYEIDWYAFEKQVKKAGMFLLCSPHNPIGKVFSRMDLLKMAELCLQNEVILVSDEIHSELLLGDQKFTPVGKLSREIARRSITLVSASKAFNVAGLRCGFAIIPDARLREMYFNVVQRFGSHINSMGLLAAQIAFSGECDVWLAELREVLTSNRDFLMEYVRGHLPGVRMTMPKATYLAWLDFSEFVRSGRIQGTPYEYFLREARVAFSDGKVFGPDHEGFIRMNFGCPRSTLEEGLERIRKSLYS